MTPPSCVRSSACYCVTRASAAPATRPPSTEAPSRSYAAASDVTSSALPRRLTAGTSASARPSPTWTVRLAGRVTSSELTSKRGPSRPTRPLCPRSSERWQHAWTASCALPSPPAARLHLWSSCPTGGLKRPRRHSPALPSYGAPSPLPTGSTRTTRGPSTSARLTRCAARRATRRSSSCRVRRRQSAGLRATRRARSCWPP
mmetsp:Transcript_53596/g.128508  ORF Transcript_53596/g.128508 Transcript_53596/m.128508 type:complete len:202 (+) Transcript_53596:87-692(+)